ncbi:NAD(P)/FAD-dependent oxidoreductase [Streptomyces zhihengii]|uniref:NAD(P)/FAD-dependent oxidoreductase n=1 Tax=Streptomyces zhihengii TaxID=1818004 RepID=UPI0033B727C0
MSTGLRPAPEPHTTRGIVIGGSLAGMLAAAALRPFVDEVLVLERHDLPAEPAARQGVPQARHVHTLWSNGAEAIDLLALGTTERLLNLGARHLALPADLVALSPAGWYRRWPETHHLITCSRDLLDWVVREQVLMEDADAQISVHPKVEVLGLRRWADRVTGVRVRRADGAYADLDADFVVDASGRASRAPQWLAEIGVAQAPVREVDAGLAYASRLYQAPSGSDTFPGLAVQADPLARRPGRSGTLIPIEGGRWLVSLAGTRGGEPTADPGMFESFARSLRHPVIADALAAAEPISDVSVTRCTGNRRHFFERVKAWPDGFVVLGDAVAAYNPLYGQGMSVAALAALALRTTLCDGGVRFPGVAQRAQRAIATPVLAAWSLATSQDVLYPAATGRSPGLIDYAAARYVRRVAYAATGRASIATRVTRVLTQERCAAHLLTPTAALSVLRGPLLPPLDAPPLTEKECELLAHGRGTASSRTASEEAATDR